MSKNEKIATWLGYEISHPVMGGVAQSMMVKPSGTPDFVPDYDKHLFFWHGDDGLLTVIEKAGPDLWYDFITALVVNMGPRRVIAHEEDGSDWVELGTVLIALESSPAQLTDALISAIDKGVSPKL